EKKQEQSERIKFYINRRYSDFKDNTSRMLDSILQRRAKPISYEKVITADSIITNQEEIKEAVRTHFKNWTKKNPSNDALWKEWKPFYSPLQHIHNDIYNTLLSPISTTELKQTINSAPKGKATGPSRIANEVLQQLPLSAFSILLNILN